MHRLKTLLIIFIIVEISLQAICLIFNTFYINEQSCAPGTYAPYVGFFDNSQKISQKYLYQPHPSHPGNTSWFFSGSLKNPASEHIKQFLTDRSIHYLNLTQKGYTITQARILFLELLRTYPKPKEVIFYSGFNEVDGPIIGYPVDVIKTIDILSGHYTPRTIIRNIVLGKIKTLTLLDQLCNFTSGAQHTALDINPFDKSARTDTQETAQAVVINYKHNINLIKKVCDHYGIYCTFIWDAHIPPLQNSTSRALKSKVNKIISQDTAIGKNTILYLPENSDNNSTMDLIKEHLGKTL